MQSGPFHSFSPSFNSYYSNTLAEIADRVVEECRAESESSCQEDAFSGNNKDHLISQEFDKDSRSETKDDLEKVDEHNGSGSDSDSDDDADDFEFSFVTRDADSSTISADEIFYNGQIRPMFPVFGRDLFPGNSSKPPAPVRLPLGKLLIEERKASSSSSSSSSSLSEADELEGVPQGTYCVWKPKRPAEAVGQQRKKSNSTGSLSKRWKFRELIGRSNSDGKETFVFLVPSKREKRSNLFSKAAGNGGDKRRNLE